MLDDLVKSPKRLVPLSNKAPSSDVVLTPPELAERIVAALNPSGLMLDPCCGEGAFLNAMQSYSTEPVDWYEITKGRDFLEGDLPEKSYDWIITGPPFSSPTFPLMLERCFQMATNVAFLTTLTTVVTRARINTMLKYGFGLRTIITMNLPKTWPSSGFMTALVHYESEYAGPTQMIYWDAPDRLSY